MSESFDLNRRLIEHSKELMEKSAGIYHVLFNRKGEAVNQCVIFARSFGECEQTFVEMYPDAEYWEIGCP